MKKIKNLILAFALLLQMGVAVAAEPVKIVKVISGDTVKIKRENGKKMNVRLEGVNCPTPSFSLKNIKFGNQKALCLEYVEMDGIDAMEQIYTYSRSSKETTFDFKTKNSGVLYFDGVDARKIHSAGNSCVLK